MPGVYPNGSSRVWRAFDSYAETQEKTFDVSLERRLKETLAAPSTDLPAFAPIVWSDHMPSFR
jgi:hypothetical protein